MIAVAIRSVCSSSCAPIASFLTTSFLYLYVMMVGTWTGFGEDGEPEGAYSASSGGAFNTTAIAPPAIVPKLTGATALGVVAEVRDFNVEAFETLLELTGLTRDDPVEVAAAVPRASLEPAVVGCGGTMALQGRIMVIFKVLSSIAASPPAADTDSAKTTGTDAKIKVVVSDKDPTKRKFSDQTDPLSVEYYDVLPEDVVQALYDNYKKVKGPTAKCPSAALPTADQLMAVECMRKSHPAGRRYNFYVCLALFGPYGRHTREIRLLSLTFWKPGEGGWVQKSLPGPGSLKEWLRAWKVFESACIMTGAASPFALEHYAGGLETIMTLFGNHPHAWGTVFVADKIMRSERWEAWLRELRADPPAEFDPAHPLEYMLIWSSYNSPQPPATAGAHKDWWYQCIDLPLGRSAGPSPGDNLRPIPLSDTASVRAQPLLDDPSAVRSVGAPPVTCVHCGGNHRSAKCFKKKKAGNKGSGKGKHIQGPPAPPLEAAPKAGAANGNGKRKRKSGGGKKGAY